MITMIPTSAGRLPRPLNISPLIINNLRPTKKQRLQVLHSAKHERLLEELTQLTDTSLTTWAEENADQLTLDFLTWVSEQETNASGSKREELWALGSKLVTLREGFALVSTERVNEALQNASSPCSPGSKPSTSGKSLPVVATEKSTVNRDRAATNEIISQTAALSLSAEGMILLQQQAAALEATIGVTRAQALTEIIGRVAVTGPTQISNFLESDTAGRILEVLLSMESRQDRALALIDAFTPPDENGFGDFPQDIDGYTQQNAEEEELYTTPFQLLQAVDLMLKRIRNNDTEALNANRALPGDSLALQGEELIAALVDLKDDILNYWESSGNEEF